MMIFQSLFVLASSISASVVASSDLCLQGCCGLAFKLPSTSLTLHHLTVEQSSVQVPLSNPEINCCPCDNTLGHPQALQPIISVNNDTGGSGGPVSSNGTTGSPILPSIPKPTGPAGNAPIDIDPSPCAQNQCWSDCACAPGMTPMDFGKTHAGGEQVPLLKVPPSIACPKGQCHSDCDCAPGMVPTDQPKPIGNGGINGGPTPKGPIDTEPTGNNCGQGQTGDDCDFLVNFGSLKVTSSKAAPTKAAKMLPCPEGQCNPDCECSVDGLLAFISPGTPLGSMPRVCASGECSADCICRDDLVKTAQVMASLKKHDSSSKLKNTVDQKFFTGKSEL